jgi:CHAT domain-containing protein
MKRVRTGLAKRFWLPQAPDSTESVGSAGLSWLRVLALAAAVIIAPAIGYAGSCDTSLQEGAPAAAEPVTAASAALERGNTLAAESKHADALVAFEQSEREARNEKNASLAAIAGVSAARSAALLNAGVDSGAAADTERLEEAVVNAENVDDPALRAQLRLHLGRSFMLISKERRAAELFAAAIIDSSESGATRLHSYALGYLGELYEKRGQFAEALSVTSRALFSAERAAAPDAIYRWQWQLGRIYEARSEETLALASYRDSVTTLRGARELSHGGTEPVYEGLVKLLIERADAVDTAKTVNTASSPNTRSAANTVDAASVDERQLLLAEARNTLEDQNASELRDYFHDPCLDARRKTTPDTVPGTLVVYPILLEDRIVLISSMAGKLDSHVVPIGRDAVVEEIRVFRNGLEDRTSRSYLRQARQLYDWLIGPVEPALESGKIKTLVFVPRGALYTIPLAALQDPKSKRYLIEIIPLAITPGLTLTEPQAIDRESAQLLAVGVSDAVQGFAPLDFVPEEMAAVFELFPGRQLLNKQFVAEAFEYELKQQPFDIVHLASHGEFAANAEDSFLLTYDGRISMDRLAQLVGKTRFRSRGLELLALSACESAAGDDRAALGLAGVALQAGARSALATLWAVNDEVSAQLMIDFYRRLADPSQSRVEALQQAQVKVLQQRAYRHPAYWAPYLLIGSWL